MTFDLASLALMVTLLLPWLTLALLPITRIARWVRASLPATPIVALGLALSSVSVSQNWSGLLLGSAFGVNETNRPFLLVTALAWLAASWLTIPFIRHARSSARFVTCFLLAMAGNVALVLSQDAVSFYTAFAVMSLSAYGLINHNGDSAAIFAGKVYIVLAIAGELLLFAALLGIAQHATALEFPLAFETRPPHWTIACTVLGFGIKAGLVPLHVSLPLAYAAAPHPAGVALAGAMLNAGILGWLHWLPLGAFELPVWGVALVAAGLAGVLIATVLGLLQRDARALLGYSSISQVGLMMLFLGAGLLAPDRWQYILPLLTLFVVHHGIAKTAAFCLCDGARPRRLPAAVWIALLALPGLALIGVPFSSGFVAKAVLKETLLATGGGVAGIVPWLTAASVGTVLLMARWLVLVVDASNATRSNMRGFAFAMLLIAVSFAAPLFIAAPSGLSVLGSATFPLIVGALIAFAVWRIRPEPVIQQVGRVPIGDIARPMARAIAHTAARTGTLAAAIEHKWRTTSAQVATGLHELSAFAAERYAASRIDQTKRQGAFAVFLVVLALFTTLLVVNSNH